MKTNKIALITGITGQDGSYLAEFLLGMDYEVHGVKRQTSTSSDSRLKHILDNITVHNGDMTDLSSLLNVINVVKPTEIYNLAAQSHVQVSFSSPLCTAKINGLGALNLLEAVRISNIASTCRIYQASTSEMFGRVVEVPQSEHTPFYPRSPYGVSKVMAYWGVVNYREAYNLFACNGILFNHESPRRGDNFVTRKITKAVAAIKHGVQGVLYLGNLDAERDWGHARDYVECMWLMLQQPTPEDFVIATGETTTVREFVRKAFKCIGITLSLIHI